MTTNKNSLFIVLSLAAALLLPRSVFIGLKRFYLLTMTLRTRAVLSLVFCRFISMTTTTCALCLQIIQETTNNEWVVKTKVHMQNLRWAIQVYFNIMGTACTFSIERFICDLFYTTLPAFHRRATVKVWGTCMCVCVCVCVCVWNI